MANSLLDLLKGQLNDDVINQLSQNIGADKAQTNLAAQGVLSTLVGALTKNASTQDGASSLLNALTKDHNGSILNNVMDFLNPQKPNPVPDKTADGQGILNHLLGDKQSSVANAISQFSGLDSKSIGGLMQNLAPMVMGMLGKQQQQNGLDLNGLMGLLNSEKQVAQNQQNQLSPFMRLLDTDGDGNVIDDIGGLLGKFFTKQ